MPPRPVTSSPLSARRAGAALLLAAAGASAPAWAELTAPREHWLLGHLPAPLLARGPAGLLYAQWIALPIMLALAWVTGAALSRLTRGALGRLTRRTAARWDDELVTRLSPPLTVAWMLAVTFVALPWLDLADGAHHVVHRGLRAAAVLVFFWTLSRGVDVGREVLATTAWSAEHGSARALLPLAARVLKVLLVIVAGVSLLSELGYPVGSLLAGLGIGGLAFALAAQKTVENLFGAFSIGVDQPFREGDFVKVEDFVGTVETIGLRSTRIRTLDRTLITIPNGRLADMRLESYAARDRIRLACTLGLLYSTTSSQLRAVLAGVEGVLRGHPKIWPDTVVVRLQALGTSSLDVEIMAWFTTADFAEFQLIRQEVLLAFLEVVERAGTGLAYPTQTVQVAQVARTPTISP